MRVAVYTIALNEEKFLQSWYNSAKDADYLMIADTGSSDNLPRMAQRLGINVYSISVKPWRFDDARNTALALLPNDIDYCIALDMDEQLQPGWREALEKAHEAGLTRPRYKYTWSWNGDKPGLQYGGDKIHKRHGYRWKHPVHEVLVTDRLDEVQGWVDLEIHHHPDTSKPRSQYLPLLELSTKEDPHDDRNAFYYARELYFYSEYEAAAKEFERHLSLPTATWKPERAASMRYLAKCRPEQAEHWYQLAIVEDSARREARVELGRLFYNQQRWDECLTVVEHALAITEKPLDYLCEEFAWGALPHDLAAISAYNLGIKDKAINHGAAAVELDKNNPRLANNLKFYMAMD